MAALYNAVCKSLSKGLLFLSNFEPNRLISTNLSNFEPNRRISTNFNITPNKSYEIPSDGCGTITYGERKE
jgi:hypothetical protein